MAKALFFSGIYFLCRCISHFAEHITENEIIHWILFPIEIASLILFFKAGTSYERQHTDAMKKYGKTKYLLCIFCFVLLMVAFLLGWQLLMNQLAKAGYIVAAIAATALLSFLPVGIAYIFEKKKKAEKNK